MENNSKKNFIFSKNYRFSLLLFISIIIGSLLGVTLKKDALILKPFGDIFLNLLFMVVVPLVFFSISSTVAVMTNKVRLGKILVLMLLIFIITGAISSILMLLSAQLFPLTASNISLPNFVNIDSVNIIDQIVNAVTVPDFLDLFSRKNILALIICAFIVGLASSSIGKKGEPFTKFLVSAAEILMKVISYIMYYAPIGLCAYFAYFVGYFGENFIGSYLNVVKLYYPITIIYFFGAFTIYAFFSGKFKGIKTFWTNITPPMLTALGTGSSVAAIPSNLEAANRSGIPKDISEIVIPIGSTIHMDGSCLAAMLKIVFLFSVFNMDFSSISTQLSAIGISILSGMVMSGIPGGGFTGEILIITLYGFPIEALPLISTIGMIVDPPATMINAVGDNAASMMLARILNGKKWMHTNNQKSTIKQD